MRANATDLHSDHMAGRLTAAELGANLHAVLDKVEAGEEIEITRHGLPVARLAPARGAHPLKGLFAGTASSNAEDDELFSTGVI